MAQPKIIIIKKPGETISRRKMKRYEKVAREWDKKPKERKLSRRDKKRIERERKEQLEELAQRFKKKKPARKKKSGFANALKGAFRDARKRGGSTYGTRKKKRSRAHSGLSLGGYNF
jgi:uncharacterized protein YijF (DUF1287 family)